MKLDTIVNQAVIETDRLVLRPVRKSDAGLLRMYAADERVARMSRSLPHPLPPGATDAVISRALDPDRNHDLWVLDGAEHGFGEFLGTASLDRMDREQSELWFWIAPAFWNNGLAQEAVRGLVEANPHDDKTMFATVFQDNPASARVLTNTGFQYLGDAEAYSVARGGPVPTWTYLKRLD